MRRRAGVMAAVVAAGIALTAAAAAAEEETSGWREGWHFQLSPYVWGAGLEGHVAAVSGLPKVKVDATFSDILDHTDLTFMLAAEARWHRFGFLVDMAYLDLSADANTPGPLFDDARIKSSTFFSTFSPYYRAIETERYVVDAFAGARVWQVDTKVSLTPGLVAGRSVTDDEAFIDPIFGARGSVKLLGRLYASGGGDVGGFGAASDITWQLIGTLDLRTWDWLTLRAGYRHLAVDYHHEGFVWDIAMSGPIIGAALRF